MSFLTVIVIIASNGFQPVEYNHTKAELERADIRVLTASNKAGTAYGSDGETVTVDIVLEQIKPDMYDGIFLIGGPGALEHLDNTLVYTIMKDAQQSHKIFGAICISPRILANAGVLHNKQATGWDDDHELNKIFKAHHVTYIQKPVVIDKKLVTASGPSAAKEFGKTIAYLIKNK
jgi:protease I